MTTIRNLNEGPTSGFDPETDRASAQTDDAVRAMHSYLKACDITGECDISVWRSLVGQVDRCREIERDRRVSMNRVLEEKLSIG